MKNKTYIFFFVLIISFLLFIFLLMSFAWEGKYSQERVLSNFFFNLPSWLLMGASDYFVIKLLSNKIKWKNDTVRIMTGLVLNNLFIILLFLVAHYFILSTGYSYITRYIIPLCIWNSIIVFLIEIFRYSRKQVEIEKRLATIEKEKIQYQYETLKAQVNPHFLFNSLNVLSSLAYQDAEKTNLFAKKMSGVYRYLLLTNDRPVVTLREELAFLESYIFLEQIRFEDALFVEIVNDESQLNRKVIPVSLQLLVENAVKHNITTTHSPLTIRIVIGNEGITVSNNLQLRSSVDKGGVGLKNLQRQYALYQKSIDVEQTGGDFIVRIPFMEE
ncbi:sensor histidine kinase [Dysgonomonas sp. 520]|uniref:sensor histidine kinase n=1 Tax=Dysgonomonas sp. 520 TaxID=2302931 RepID=UPI0013D37B01|nr:histidine kinase [Dysgonomonas sp. 520]NDW08520.1 histidine kinase [Dysgonomonas sp. 520]